MRKIILEKLKAKFEGVSDFILDRVAGKLAKTVTTEEEATTAVAGVTLQQLFDSYGDSRATEAQVSAVENYEKKYGLKDGAKVKDGDGPDGKKDDGKRIHLLEKQETGVFAMTIPVDVCFLKQESPLKAVYDKGKAKAKAAAKAIRLKEEKAQKAANREYARKCGKLARKYGLDFGDVLALGTDETTLKNYILALAEARDLIRQMDRKEKDALRHELYECGRARKRAAMKSLGIETLADPNRLTLQELCEAF